MKSAVLLLLLCAAAAAASAAPSNGQGVINPPSSSSSSSSSSASSADGGVGFTGVRHHDGGAPARLGSSQEPRSWAPCEKDDDCRHSGNCVDKRCAAPANTLDLGEACLVDSECLSGSCSGDTGLLKKTLRDGHFHGHCIKQRGMVAGPLVTLKQLILPKIDLHFKQMRKINAMSFKDSAPGMKIRGYYTSIGDHARHSPIKSRFKGQVSCVRVTLPISLRLTEYDREKSERRGVRMQTRIGTVYSFDHKVFSVEEFNNRFLPNATKENSAVRVDLITPARTKHGAMFSAVGQYAAYRRGDTSPFMYVLTAGMASGKFMQMYSGYLKGPKAGKLVRSRHDYVPTPFSVAQDYYDHSSTWVDDEPKSFVVHSTHHEEDEPYMTVTLRYYKWEHKDDDDHSTTHDEPSYSHVLKATARIFTIAEAMGLKMDVPWIIRKGFLKYGQAIRWLDNPKDSPKPPADVIAREQARHELSVRQGRAQNTTLPWFEKDAIAPRDETKRNSISQAFGNFFSFNKNADHTHRPDPQVASGSGSNAADVSPASHDPSSSSSS